jgi:hypothetical protein
MRNKIAVFIVISVVLVMAGIARHYLVPWHADETRRTFLLTGDEPDYLLSAISISRDFDLDVSNNIQNEDYRLFQQRPVGGGDFTFYNKLAQGRLDAKCESWGDRRYMQHRPGTSFVLSPLVTISGQRLRWISYFWISMLLALWAGYILLETADAILAPVLAMGVILVFTLSPPVLFYANQVYPEVFVGAFLSISVLYLILQKQKYYWVGVLLLSAAIWFSDRSLPAVFVLACALLYQGRKLLSVRIVSGVFAISIFLFCIYCYQRFGVPWPISHNHIHGFSLMRIPPRMLQVVFDSKQGWLWLFWPLMLAPFCIFDLMWNKNLRWRALPGVAAFVLVIVLVAAFDDWRGGTNPRGRYYVIPQMLMMPLFLYWVGSGCMTRIPRKILAFFGLGMVSILITSLVIRHPNWWFRNYHPAFGWARLNPYYDVLPHLPDDSPPSQWIKAFLYLAVFGITLSVWLYFPIEKIKMITRRFHA